MIDFFKKLFYGTGNQNSGSDIFLDLDKVLWICYSTPNYDALTSIFLKSLIDTSVNKKNIIHKLDEPPKDLTAHTGFQSNLWYHCANRKIDHLINTLKDQKNKFEYYIFSDCDIQFFKNKGILWNNLFYYIKRSNAGIFFTRENNTDDLNCGFYIIKNKNIDKVIDYFSYVYKIILSSKKKDIPYGEQTIINNTKHILNYGFIPKKYYIYGNFFDNKKNTALFHHAVCCRDVDDKINQMNYINKLMEGDR